MAGPNAQQPILPRDEDPTEIDLPPYFDEAPPPRMPSFTLETRSAEDVWKASDEVAARRKRFARVVAGVVGVAWGVCQLACARTIASSVVSAWSDDVPAQTARR